MEGAAAAAGNADLLFNSDSCAALTAARRGVYGTCAPSCHRECRVYHKILYLEFCIANGIALEAGLLADFLIDDAPRVRRLAQAIAGRDGVATRPMVGDPTAEIRTAHLQTTDSIDELLQFINDENVPVRTCILRRLQTRSGEPRLHVAVPAARQEEVLRKLNHYINDKSPAVRLEFVRALAAFDRLSPKFICKLFNKKSLGLFIYGAEDEMQDVRNELIASIDTFVSSETAGIVFEYLIDMLNDETGVVRETAIAAMCRISRRHKLVVSDAQLSSIISGLEESSIVIQDGLLRLIRRLRYETIDIYFHLIRQTNLETTKVLRILGRLIARNRRLFKKNLSALYVYSPFDRYSGAAPGMERLRSLYDVEYLAELVLLKTLSKSYEIPLAPFTRKHFNFLRLKLFKLPLESTFSEAAAAHNAVTALISGPGAVQDLPAMLVDAKTPSALYFVELYSAYASYCRDGSKLALYKFKFAFECPRARHAEFVDELVHIKSDRKVRQRILEHLKAFTGPECYGEISTNEFILNASSSIVAQAGCGERVLAQFEVFAYCSSGDPSLRLVAEDPVTQQTISYPVHQSTLIVINDAPACIHCYISADIGGHVIKLSAVHAVCVEKGCKG